MTEEIKMPVYIYKLRNKETGLFQATGKYSSDTEEKKGRSFSQIGDIKKHRRYNRSYRDYEVVVYILKEDNILNIEEI